MMSTSTLFNQALSQARQEWLLGDPSAWSRYTMCLARLEERKHLATSTQNNKKQDRRTGRWNPFSTPHSHA